MPEILFERRRDDQPYLRVRRHTNWLYVEVRLPAGWTPIHCAHITDTVSHARFLEDLIDLAAEFNGVVEAEERAEQARRDEDAQALRETDEWTRREMAGARF